MIAGRRPVLLPLTDALSLVVARLISEGISPPTNPMGSFATWAGLIRLSLRRFRRPGLGGRMDAGNPVLPA